MAELQTNLSNINFMSKERFDSLETIDDSQLYAVEFPFTDEDLVHTTGDEEISGVKTFNDSPMISTDVADARITTQFENIKIGETPLTTTFAGFKSVDQDGTEFANCNCSYNTNERVGCNFYVAKQDEEGTIINGTLGVFIGKDDAVAYTQAPNPQDGDNSTKIATTNWTTNNAVMLNGNQTVNGVKTFTEGLKYSTSLNTGGSYAIKTVDTNGIGETGLVSYYTGETVYGRLIATNHNAGKTAYFEVTAKDDGSANMRMGGSSTPKYADFQDVTKFRVPTATASSETSEAVNIAFLNDINRSTNVVHRNGTETITGTKTFTTSIRAQNSTGDLTTAPTSNVYGTPVYMTDKNGTYAGALRNIYLTDGTIGVDIQVSRSVDGTAKYGEMGVRMNTDGTAFTYAPTPAAGDNSTKIATTNWCYDPAKSTNLVHRTGNETIGGTKTFSSTVQGTAYRALWGDLAEYYDSDKEYPRGTLVKFGGEKEITIANDEVNAVITSEPGFILNTQQHFNAQSSQAIALVGKVPVRVIGKVNKFDYLTLSDIPGVAISMANVNVANHNIIARALESKNSEGEGLVLCVIKFAL